MAAHLPNGVNPRELGPVIDRLELLPVVDRAEVTNQGIRGSMPYVDRFGTLVTNIRRVQLMETGGRNPAS